MVTAVVAILTAVAVEFTWRERVNLHLASHARDELRAEYLARSAVNLGRVLLLLQQQIAAQAKTLGLPTGPIDLTGVVPLDCGLLRMAAQGFAAPPEESLEEGAVPGTSFGDFEGGCHAEIQIEESKVNLNHLDGLPAQRKNAINQLLADMSAPRFDFLFEEEDRWGVRLTREEVVGAIKDYIDADQTQDALVPEETGYTLVPGTGDESYYYDRIEPSQGPKNAPLDSVDELYRIPGIGDYFMSAFADRFTVYTGKNAKQLIDPKGPRDLLGYLVLGAKNQAEVYSLNDEFLIAFMDQIEERRERLPFMGISPEEFSQLMEANGIEPNNLAFTGTTAIFATTAQTFTIRATGQAGEVQKTIEAVVSFDSETPDAATPLGRLLHWEER